ncbi:MAG: zinc-binding dehydrogenase, partial [Micromonosporaceae bacterium]|nr:zinc-binding dehydrogenase [Micromonosporaceae bacterium]
TGAGPIGILAAQVAKASGAAHVTVMDINPDRLAVAAKLGADSTVDARDEVALHASEPRILIECTGAAAAVRAGIGALRPAGTAVLVGMGPDSEQPLPVRHIQQYELTVTGLFRYANTYPQAIALAAAGRVRLDELVGARLPLEETERALRMGRTDPSVLKTVVRP